ncbi:MAG: tryptophan--tRNA ligase [Clostridiales bacterium]|jgi:tryptophanyl-tRNA synthetase|nr:tryptophan--tRNA ligase [Clostridiales bacterium]
MKTILSGIQSSGQLTLGNYLGALKNWVDLQANKDYKNIFFIADLHSITVRQDPQTFRQRRMEILKIFIAAGLAGGNNLVFFQSDVPQHAQLGWILDCYCNLGELSRMTQFKDKTAKQDNAGVNAGLFTYPVLMAADILLYQADLVPVGADQKQHLELCRNIANRFNGIYGDVFTMPDGYIPKVGARIMSLQSPENKMSKSDPNTNGYVAILDEPDVIVKKVKRAITDSLNEVKFDDNNPEKAAINNLITMYATINNISTSDVENEFDGKGYGAFKSALAEAIVEELRPLQQRYKELDSNPDYVQKVYTESSIKAQVLAQKTLDKVYEVIGF